MNKTRERKILDYIYGDREGLAVIPSEKPDFLCSLDSGYMFGVEVTEFFLSESAARLRRIPNYTMELLETEVYRHKDDKQLIPVEMVKLIKGAGEEVEFKAVLSEMHTVDVVVERLTKLIDAKHTKFSQYSSRVRPVDLIIHDVDRLASFDTMEDLLRPIAESRTWAVIRDSPYREIYVVTKERNGGPVSIPLRTNVFIAEAFAFQYLFREYHASHLESLLLRDYLQPLAAYLVSMFPNIEHEVGGKKEIRFVLGISALWYENGLKVEDVSTKPHHDRLLIATDATYVIEPALLEFVKTKRAGMFCCFPIRNNIETDEVETLS